MQIILIICYTVIVSATMNILLKIAALDKEVRFFLSEREKCICELLCLVNGIVLGGWQAGEQALLATEQSLLGGEQSFILGLRSFFWVERIPRLMSARQMVLLSIFAGCLLMACVTDKKICRVYHFTWWLGDGAGLFLVLLYVSDNGSDFRGSLRLLIPLLVFGLLQELLFCRMYGRADSHAFCACAIVECAFGMGMKEYLIHMLIAFGLLALVQMLRRNIGKNGNLKQPVPFLPYITLAFWGMQCAKLMVVQSDSLISSFLGFLGIT